MLLRPLAFPTLILSASLVTVTLLKAFAAPHGVAVQLRAPRRHSQGMQFAFHLSRGLVFLTVQWFIASSEEGLAQSDTLCCIGVRHFDAFPTRIVAKVHSLWIAQESLTAAGKRLQEMYSRMYSSRELTKSWTDPSKMILPSRRRRKLEGAWMWLPGGMGSIRLSFSLK